MSKSTKVAANGQTHIVESNENTFMFFINHKIIMTRLKPIMIVLKWTGLQFANFDQPIKNFKWTENFQTCFQLFLLLPWFFGSSQLTYAIFVLIFEYAPKRYVFECVFSVPTVLFCSSIVVTMGLLLNVMGMFQCWMLIGLTVRAFVTGRIEKFVTLMANLRPFGRLKSSTKIGVALQVH